MKKTFLALLVCAIAVWGYVVARIAWAVLGRTEASAQSRHSGNLPEAILFFRSRIRLDTSFRDPFQSYLYAQKPSPVLPGPIAGKPRLKVIEPPQAVLSGILWGDEPVAILKQGGQTELVKQGTEIWDFKVLRIDRNQVVIRKQGRQFSLEY